EQLRERIDRRTGDTDVVERGVPRFDRSRRNHILHMLQRFGAMPDPIRIAAEFGIVDDRLEPRDSAELAPEVIIGYPDHDRSSCRLEGLVGAKRFMAGATFGRLDSALPEGLQIVAQKPKRGVE